MGNDEVSTIVIYVEGIEELSIGHLLASPSGDGRQSQEERLTGAKYLLSIPTGYNKEPSRGEELRTLIVDREGSRLLADEAVSRRLLCRGSKFL